MARPYGRGVADLRPALALAALTGLALGSGCETQAAGVEDSLRRVLRAAGAKAMSSGLSKADPVDPQ